MSILRRQVNPTRRFVDSGNIPLSSALHQKSRSSPLLSVVLVIVGMILILGYSYGSSGFFGGEKEVVSHIVDGGGGGERWCAGEVERAIPYLGRVYGEKMKKVLHVGPDTCRVVSKLYGEGGEAWGVEPYDMEEGDGLCRRLVQKGMVRVADLHFPLPYRPRSFSLLILSDVPDYLSPRYLNRTLPDLARLSHGSLLIFTGRASNKGKAEEMSKFGRPAKKRSWTFWIKYFGEKRMVENKTASNLFKKAITFSPSCNIFHLSSL